NASDTSVHSAHTEKDSATPSPHRLQWFFHCLAALALLVILFLQLYLGVRNKSATLDEQNHIARGLALLRTGDTRMNLIHPPLINVISALPLFRDKGVKLPLDDISWKIGDYNGFGVQFMWVVNDNGPAIVSRARVPVMILSVLLGALIFIWTFQLAGPMPAILALSFYCFDPNILANGALATNDLGMAFFTCLAAYAFWQLLSRPGWLRASLAGAALGLALTAKFSAIFLVAALPAIALGVWLATPKQDRAFPRPKHLALLAAVLLGSAFIALWAAYGFQIHYAPFTGFPVPAQAYLDGLDVSRASVFGDTPAFLLGSYSRTGWWCYFPIAFLVKTPLPALILIAGSIIFAFIERAWNPIAILLTPVVIYFALAISSPLNIGYRHLLPILPFLFVFAGRFAIFKGSRFRWIQFTPILLAAWLIAGTIRTYPNYLTYFNEAAGGPSGGARILADSNLDWGQDLPGLREYMTREKIDSIRLSYFGSAHPEAYGISNFDPLPSYPYNYHGVEKKVSELSHPPPGVYAISVTNLQGVFFKDHDLYKWFRDRAADAVIGHTIYVYRVK
ncbi:MAG TPA: phospholipid carrier-dependent glycosyltransferase, partial [Blastocatellia bacterium]|nr:phospholipid carrier-dependent glycosyltransferase [Blastocatellia bacterium]